MADGGTQARFGVAIQLVASAEVGVVSRGIDSACFVEIFLRLRRERRADLLGDCTGHLALHREHVLHLPLVSLRPHAPIGLTVEQGRGDHDLIRRAGERGFDDAVDAELSRDLPG